MKLLVAVMGYGNRETGAAHPGARTLAEEIYRDLQQFPPVERAAALDKAAGVIMNMFTLLKQCGYDVSMRRAPAEGTHAVSHHALTYPDREEMLAAIPIHQQWQEQETARKADAKKKAPQPSAQREVRSPNAAREVTDLTRGVRSEGADLTRTTVSDLTRRQEISAPLSITEPGSLFNLHIGADAPLGVRGEKGLSDGAPDQGGAPPERAQTPAKGASCKPSSAEPKGKRAAPTPKATEEQFARFWAAYPIRDGKAAALRNFLKLTRDEAELAIIGAAGYAAKITAERQRLAKRGEEPRIKWAQGWLTERRFEDYEPANAAAPAGLSLPPHWWRDDPSFAAGLELADWQLLCDTHAKNGAWPTDMMGPPPGTPGCLVPRSIIPNLKVGRPQ